MNFKHIIYQFLVKSLCLQFGFIIEVAIIKSCLILSHIFIQNFLQSEFIISNIRNFYLAQIFYKLIKHNQKSTKLMSSNSGMKPATLAQMEKFIKASSKALNKQVFIDKQERNQNRNSLQQFMIDRIEKNDEEVFQSISYALEIIKQGNQSPIYLILKFILYLYHVLLISEWKQVASEWGKNAFEGDWADEVTKKKQRQRMQAMISSCIRFRYSLSEQPLAELEGMLQKFMADNYFRQIFGFSPLLLKQEQNEEKNKTFEMIKMPVYPQYRNNLDCLQLNKLLGQFDQFKKIKKRNMDQNSIPNFLHNCYYRSLEEMFGKETLINFKQLLKPQSDTIQSTFFNSWVRTIGIIIYLQSTQNPLTFKTAIELFKSSFSDYVQNRYTKDYRTRKDAREELQKYLQVYSAVFNKIKPEKFCDQTSLLKLIKEIKEYLEKKLKNLRSRDSFVSDLLKIGEKIRSRTK